MQHRSPYVALSYAHKHGAGEARIGQRWERWWKFWTPFKNVLFCKLISVAAVGILSTGVEAVAQRVAFSVIAVCLLVHASLCVYDMIYLIYYASHKDDDRLGLGTVILLPAAWLVAFGLVNMAEWTWDRDGWYYMNDLSSVWWVWLHFTADVFTMWPSLSAKSVLAKIVCACFQYSFTMVIISTGVSACTSIVMESSKPSHESPAQAAPQVQQPHNSALKQEAIRWPQ